MVHLAYVVPCRNVRNPPFISQTGQEWPFQSIITHSTGHGCTARQIFFGEITDHLRFESLAGVENAEIVFRDVLKCSDEELLGIIGGRFKVVANIPYYITTPLVMRFAESSLPVDSVTVTVQKEVAERLVAEAGTPEYGAISATVALRGNARITREVPRRMFRPVPNVDSAVVRIDLVPDKFGADVGAVSELVRQCFRMRRKTLLNNLIAAGYGKEKASLAIERAGFPADVRGERLSAKDYVELFGELNSAE